MTSPTDPLIGRLVAHYEITAKIGGGGMGVVYKARDTKLGRTVALKCLPRQWSHDESARERFRREAQAASAANHRNICTIHDIVQSDDEQLFIVMAYYEGPTLKQQLESGALPIEEALEIATELAEGLTKAHSQGVVHRDIKPGNLMLTDDGVKILDFGLAKFANALQLTLMGSTVGTVAYMSPEQARAEEADELSDVWAVGVVLYEMVTGEVPFKGSHPEATLYAIKNEPTPSLSTPERAIPESVERIVSLALQKDRALRYQSARELARDLRMIQGRSLPLDLRTAPLPPVPRKVLPKPLPWWRRVLTPARAAAAAVVLLAAAGGAYWWMARPVNRIPVAIAPVANRTGEPELDRYRLAMTQALVGELSESPNIRVTPYLRILEMVRRFITGGGDISSREAVQAIATQSGARFVVVPALAYRGGAWLGQAEIRDVATGTNIGTLETEAVTSSLPKETTYRLMASLAAGVQEHFKVSWPQRAPGERPAGARFRNLDAARAFEEGLNDYERMEYSTALGALRRATEEDPERAIAHAWVSRISLLMGQRREAEAAGQRAVQLVTAETPRPDALFAAATLADARADVPAAEARYRELAALHPDDPTAQTELADFLKRQGRNQEAIEAYREALRRDERYAKPHVDLCQIYVQLDDYPLAEGEARSALAKFRAVGNRAGEAQVLLCLGDGQRKQGGEHLIEANRSIEAARDLFESLGQTYALSRVYQYLGLVAGAERDFPAAAKAFEEVLLRSRRIGNRTNEGLALMNLGAAHQQLGQRAQAVKYYEQSRDFYQQIGDERRAAEQEVNAAVLLINFGRDHEAALRRLANAQAMVRKLGQIEFDVFATGVQAWSEVRAGRNTEGRRQLLQALSFANERQLSGRIVLLTQGIADSYFLLNEYEEARKTLEKLVASNAGQRNLGARIALGRTYIRLGDFGTARKHLEQAVAGIESNGETALWPVAYEALGELAYESGNLPGAREHFSRAAALWTDDLPDASSLEARCHQSLLEVLGGAAPKGRQSLEEALEALRASVKQARSMGRLYLEVQCRLNLARIQTLQTRFSDASAALNEIAPGGEQTIGPELQALVHYWRSRLAAARGEHDQARTEALQARTLAEQLRQSLSATYQDSFSLRTDIRPLLQ